MAKIFFQRDTDEPNKLATKLSREEQALLPESYLDGYCRQWRLLNNNKLRVLLARSLALNAALVLLALVVILFT